MLIDIIKIDKHRINIKEQFHLNDETARSYSSIVAFYVSEKKLYGP